MEILFAVGVVLAIVVFGAWGDLRRQRQIDRMFDRMLRDDPEEPKER